VETYYNPEDLPRFPDIGQQAPELAQKFFDYYNAVFAEGALTEREKALIALAVAHALQCSYCIDAFSQACLEKGCNL
jgi:4-carboxymuconolactone decarboxylase